MSTFAKPFLGLALIASATPLSAEVVEKEDGHFVTRDVAVVDADLKETWLAMIAPAKWWNSAHTFTGDSANLTLTPQAGGCFCEKVPEIDEPGRFTLEGSVEHLRVVNAQPETALRMVGALGPLQSEPVRGVLTIALTKVDEGTRVVLEYNVGGPMRYDVDTISKAVDGVMSQQLDGLAQLLGRAELTDAEEAKNRAELAKAIDEEVDEDESPAEADGEKRESVEDAFGDLGEEEPGNKQR